jgi:hypothetical protein
VRHHHVRERVAFHVERKNEVGKLMDAEAVKIIFAEVGCAHAAPRPQLRHGQVRDAPAGSRSARLWVDQRRRTVRVLFAKHGCREWYHRSAVGEERLGLGALASLDTTMHVVAIHA